MNRKLLLALTACVIVSACTTSLGRSVPECDSVTTSLVLQVQAVPGAAYVSCINGLKTGWKYQHLDARSGRSVFSLDSDRMGDSFVTVESLLSCDIGDATRSDSGNPSIQLFKDVVSKTTVDIVLVPEGTTEITRTYAADVRAGLEDTEIKGRITAVTVSIADASTASRVSQAAATGAHVITISLRDTEEGTLTLILGGQKQEYEGNLEEVIDAIEDAETQSSYHGAWYYVFEGGCVVYTFDAEGPGVNTIESDIELTLGLYDAAALRQLARDAGYNVQ